MTVLHSKPPRGSLREGLIAGRVVGIMSVRLVRGAEIALLADALGFEALYVDMEHSTLSVDEAGRICAACRATGVTPLVRVPQIDEAHVSRVLDAGAMGIIGPHIGNTNQARHLVQLYKFQPQGKRSAIACLPQLGYRQVSADQARRLVNAATIVVTLIEDAEGLANADAIAAVDGVDVLLVGSNDLSADLGIDESSGPVQLDAAFAAVIDACRRHGKTAGVGGLVRHPDLMARYVAMGARLVSMGTDLAFLLEGARQQAAAVTLLAQGR